MQKYSSGNTILKRLKSTCQKHVVKIKLSVIAVSVQITSLRSVSLRPCFRFLELVELQLEVCKSDKCKI